MLVSTQHPATHTQAPSTRHITTLYALMEALQEHGDPSNDAQISATVIYLCQVGRLRFLSVNPDDSTSEVGYVKERADDEILPLSPRYPQGLNK